MTYMLDTNICIYTMKKVQPVMQRVCEKAESDELVISSVTLSELWDGVYSSTAVQKNTDSLNRFLEMVSVLQYGEAAAEEYGKIRGLLKKAGTPIGQMDTLIAAHAKSAGFTVVTNNMREFERVPDLKLENWYND